MKSFKLYFCRTVFKVLIKCTVLKFIIINWVFVYLLKASIHIKENNEF